MLFRGIALLSAIIAAAVTFPAGLSLWTLLMLFVVSYVVLTLISLAFLLIVLSFVDMDKPQEHDSPFYRAVMHVYIEALIMLVKAKVHPSGLEKTPKEGRFLLVCNHLALADPGILLHYFKKSQLAFITKQENEKMPVINKFMHKIMCQSLDRENDRSALKTILRCISLIKEDEVSICVFPEGYTSKDGKLHHFRSGAFKIAQKTKVPIVVCTIQNTNQIFKNLPKLKSTDVALHLVDVIPPEAYEGKSTVEISDMVYERMISDLGEEFRSDPT